VDLHGVGWESETSLHDAAPVANALGYDARGSKKLIVQSARATGFDAFRVIGADGRVALEGTLEKAAVDRWAQGFFFRGTFPDLRAGCPSWKDPSSRRYEMEREVQSPRADPGVSSRGASGDAPGDEGIRE
jgi:hypothetical protein